MGDMSQFDADLAKSSIRGQWQYDEMMERLIGGPKSTAVPMCWPWELMQAKLLETCEVMQESLTARRNLSLINPGLERGGTSQTILAGMQAVKPGEIAWSHRHPISALRFAIDGDEDLYTVVDGERFAMCPNDLILTPAWSWHDHHNESKKLGIWLDVLDVPLMGGLGQMAYEPLGETVQPERAHRGEYLSERAGLVRPQWEQSGNGRGGFRYPWVEVKAKLDEFCKVDQASPYDDVLLEYVNPVNGGPTLPSLRCAIQKLRSGFDGQRHRKTCSTVYYVVEGEGKTAFDDTSLNWKSRDVFVVPTWQWHKHKVGAGGATLFSVTDAPLLEYLGLSREEPRAASRASAAPVVSAVGR